MEAADKAEEDKVIAERVKQFEKVLHPYLTTHKHWNVKGMSFESVQMHGLQACLRVAQAAALCQGDLCTSAVLPLWGYVCMPVSVFE